MNDVNLKLLLGIPLKVDNISITTRTIKEIAEIGESNYYLYLNLLLFDIEEVKKEMKKTENIPEFNELTAFELLTVNCVIDNDFKKQVEKAMSFFIQKDVLFYYYEEQNIALFCVDKDINNTINKNNYDDFTKILKLQNNIKKKQKEEYNVKSEKGKEILKALMKGREKLNKIKPKEEESLTLFDLVSIYLAHGNITSPSEVFNMNMYLFYNQFQRMEMIEEYDVNIQSLLHGADSSKIQLKHYMRKM